MPSTCLTNSWAVCSRTSAYPPTYAVASASSQLHWQLILFTDIQLDTGHRSVQCTEQPSCMSLSCQYLLTEQCCVSAPRAPPGGCFASLACAAAQANGRPRPWSSAVCRQCCVREWVEERAAYQQQLCHRCWQLLTGKQQRPVLPYQVVHMWPFVG